MLRHLAALLMAVPLATGAATLFRPAPAPKSTRAPQMLVAPSAIEMDLDALRAAAPGTLMDATLPDGGSVSIRLESLEAHPNGDVSWRGKVIDGARDDLHAFGTTGEAGTYGQIETATGTWGIVPSASGQAWLFDQTATDASLPAPAIRDDARIPAGRPDEPAPKATCPTTTAMPTPQATLDVLVVLAPDFITAHGGAAGAETRLNYLFNTYNSYNAASNVAITFRRVATMKVQYQSAATAGDDDGAALDALTNNSGAFAYVERLRNFYGADLVLMLRGPKSTSGNSISGIAWVTGNQTATVSSFDGQHMYAVSGDWPYPDATVSAHELGHILGNNHDRPNAGGGTPGSTPYSYGHYVCGTGASGCGGAGITNAGTGFGTIMAYERPTVGKFASPALSCKGAQAGAITAPCGVDNQQDDVRAMNCVRQAVAAVRTSGIANCTNLATDSDNDGIPDCLEAGSGKTNGTRDNDIFSSGLLFAAQQYRDFLAREGDADGLNFWAGAIDGGQYSRAQAIESFFNSGEFQGQFAPLVRLYYAYFLRTPDYAGLQYWIGQLRGGATLASVSQQFAASPEFVQRYGSLDNRAFVNLVYANVLGRAPDAGGLAYWTDQLDRGLKNRGEVMTGFSESPEYRTAMNSRVYVTMVYNGMMRRAPDASGLAYWTAQLDQGAPGLGLISGFLTSPEYRRRFLP